MSNLIPVPFHGDVLEAVQGEGTLYVGIRRVCENLGIAVQSQLAKLHGAPWAVVTMIVTTGPDGKNYGTACIDLDSLPMWLATIQPSRVADHARPKLSAYQRECARALRDHFFGSRLRPSTEALTAAITHAVTAAISAAIPQILAHIDARIDGPRAQRVEPAAPHDAAIGPRTARAVILDELTAMAELRSGDTQRGRAFMSARSRADAELRTHVGWRRTWAALPTARLGDAVVKLQEMSSRR